MLEEEGEIEYVIDIKEQSNRFGIISGKNIFKALSNFTVEIDMEVKTSKCGILGYISGITLYDGKYLGQAFFLRSHAESGRREWTKSITASIGSHSLYTHATDSQISAYLMRKLEQFYSSAEENSFKKAVEVVGLQPGEKNLWVLNKNIHIKEGQLIPPEDSPYCWVSANGLPPLDMQCNVATSENMVVDGALALHNLIYALRDVHQKNFPAALLLFGAQLLNMHYEQIYNVAGQVPATLAYGKVSLGKTRAAEAAQSIVGLPPPFKAKVTDKQAARLASLSTLGFLIDDPSVPNEFCEKVLAHFERGVVMSCTSSYQPRCTFTVTLNMKCFEAFASMPKRYITRTVLVPFVESDSTSMSSDVISRMYADQNLKTAMKDASKAACLALHMDFSSSEAEVLLQSILNDIQTILPASTPQRIKISYGWIILCTLMLLDKAGLKDHLQDEIWAYFKKDVAKAILKYQLDQTISTGGGNFLDSMLCKAVKDTPAKQVLTFLRSDLKRKENEEWVEFIAFLPQELKKMLIEKGEKLPADFLSILKSIYKKKSCSPCLFLSRTSRLSSIPSGLKWRSSPDCVYSRPALIAKSTLLPSTLEILQLASTLETNKLSKSRLAAIKSSLAATPSQDRLRRMKKRGPGSASRKWCTAAASPISPIYARRTLSSLYSASPKRLKSVHLSPFLQRRIRAKRQLSFDEAVNSRQLRENSPPALPQQSSPPAALPQQRSSPPVLRQQRSSPPTLPQQSSPPPALPQQSSHPALPQQSSPPPALPLQSSPPPALPQQSSHPALPQQSSPPPALPQQSSPPPALLQLSSHPPALHHPQQSSLPPALPQQSSPSTVSQQSCVTQTVPTPAVSATTLTIARGAVEELLKVSCEARTMEEPVAKKSKGKRGQKKTESTAKRLKGRKKSSEYSAASTKTPVVPPTDTTSPHSQGTSRPRRTKGVNRQLNAAYFL